LTCSVARKLAGDERVANLAMVAVCAGCTLLGFEGVVTGFKKAFLREGFKQTLFKEVKKKAILLLLPPPAAF
jgi:hypothetical protein